MNVVASRGSVERDDSVWVTRMQSGVTAAIQKMSRGTLLNNNTINMNSPTRCSGPGNM